LFAVQNGTSPRRILKLRITPEGDRISYFEVREIVAAGAGEPTLATLRNGELWYVGDGQWERYGPRGAIKDGKPARPTAILRDPGDEIVLAGH
jgi:hypothetical protein